MLLLIDQSDEIFAFYSLVIKSWKERPFLNAMLDGQE